MYGDIKNGFNLEHPKTNESIDPYFLFFLETPCSCTLKLKVRKFTQKETKSDKVHNSFVKYICYFNVDDFYNETEHKNGSFFVTYFYSRMWFLW